MPPRRMSESLSIAVEPGAAFDRVLRAPLEQVFTRWSGPIPPVSGTDQLSPGEWGTPGQRRRVRLADRSTALETLTTVESPRRFAYDLEEVRGPLRLVARRVEGSWSLTPHGTGSRLEWEWLLHPTRWAGPVLPLVELAWHRYARSGLRELSRIVGGAPAQ